MAKEQDGEAGKKFPRLPFKIAQFSELLRQEELHKLCKMLSKQILYHLGLLVNSAYNMFSINLIFFSPLCPFVPVMEVCVCIQSREVRSDHKWQLETCGEMHVNHWLKAADLWSDHSAILWCSIKQLLNVCLLLKNKINRGSQSTVSFVWKK